MEKLIVKNSITINAPASRVWNLLTKPEETKKYMFGCETVSDWKPGSELKWVMQHEGKDFVAVKGKVVDIRPGEYLAYTTIDPNNPAVADLPQNYLTVTYELSQGQNGHTILTATQGDYATVGEGDKRYKETMDGGGWEPILVQIKKLAEEV